MRKTLATTLKHRGSRVFNDAGELNASNKKDALAIIASLLEGDQLKDVVSETEAEADEGRQERASTVAAIIADKTLSKSAETGVEMAATILQSINRAGFMRNLLRYQPLEQGQRPEVTVTMSEVEAATVIAPTQVRLQVVRGNLIMPPEVALSARILVTGADMNVARGDILQEKYDSGVEAFLVAEDRLFVKAAKSLAQSNARIVNHVSTDLTPMALAAGMGMVSDWGLPLGAILMPSNLMPQITMGQVWADLIDPFTRMEILRTGRLGTIYGAEIITDGARDPSMKVLEPNEILFLAGADYLGEYTDRGGIQAVPIGPAETGINGFGWHMVEYLSATVANHRGVGMVRLQ